MGGTIKLGSDWNTNSNGEKNFKNCLWDFFSNTGGVGFIADGVNAVDSGRDQGAHRAVGVNGAGDSYWKRGGDNAGQ